MHSLVVWKKIKILDVLSFNRECQHKCTFNPNLFSKRWRKAPLHSFQYNKTSRILSGFCIRTIIQLETSILVNFNKSYGPFRDDGWLSHECRIIVRGDTYKNFLNHIWKSRIVFFYNISLVLPEKPIKFFLSPFFHTVNMIISIEIRRLLTDTEDIII